MPYLPVHDLTLYYEEHGPTEGEPMVLLHGFNGTGARVWQRFVPAFADRYRLIVHGDCDQFFPAEMPLALHRLIPESELCILPNTGHGTLSQHPDVITTLVQDFLARRA